MLGATPLETAEAHLKAGRLDDVLQAVDGVEVAPEDVGRLVLLLNQGARAAEENRDEALALLFAQRALSKRPQDEATLEFASRLLLKQHEYAAAERYADRWCEANPRSSAARLLRAELAVEAGEWRIALDQLSLAPMKGADAIKAKGLRERAERELAEKRSALSRLATLEERIARAAVLANRPGARTAAKEPAAKSNEVIVYGTSWCAFCKKARAFLKARGVPFIDKDVEKDKAAVEELTQKAMAARVRPDGVPVLDVKGTLILGYDEQAIVRALR